MKTFKEYITEGKFANEHHAKLIDYKTKKYKSIRRQNDKFGDGISVTWGIPQKGSLEIITIIFDKDKFTPAKAKKWLKDHNKAPIEFVKAGT